MRYTKYVRFSCLLLSVLALSACEKLQVKPTLAEAPVCACPAQPSEPAKPAELKPEIRVPDRLGRRGCGHLQRGRQRGGLRRGHQYHDAHPGHPEGLLEPHPGAHGHDQVLLPQDQHLPISGRKAPASRAQPQHDQADLRRREGPVQLRGLHDVPESLP